MVRTAQFLHDQLRAYSQSWQEADTPDCRELENWLQIGLSYFRTIQDIDCRWSDEVQRGERTWSEGDARSLMDLYGEWLRPCDAILAAVKVVQKEGCPVEGAKLFRAASIQAKSIVSIPLDRVVSALQNPAPGRTTAEIRDELRRKVEARS